MNLVKKINNEFQTLNELFAYGLIGLFTSTMDGLVFTLLRHLNVNLFFSNFIGINVGIALSFILNTFLNFKQKEFLMKKFVSFFMIGYVGLFLSMLFMLFFVKIMHLNEIIIKIFSIIFIAILQFILNKTITYRRKN